jgi:hypothetical protein
MKNLLTRLRRTGLLFLIGIFLIIYLGLGALFIQQSPKQKELNDQIAKQGLVAAKPLPPADKLKAEADEVKVALAPLTDYAVLEVLVKIARQSGINVDDAAKKFSVPPAGKATEVKIGEGKYQVMPIKNIKVQGAYDNVVKFVADLDAGNTLKTMVLRKAVISEVEIVFEDVEKERRQEWQDVQAAVETMMAKNSLQTIPYPRDSAGEIAFNDMTAFPDAISDWTGDVGGKTADPKGNSYLDGDKAGYILLSHDIIGDGKLTGLVDYLKLKTTKYYYTCEADGQVRQFGGAVIYGAVEYLGSEPSRFETQAAVDVDIYFKVEKPAETKPATQTPPKTTTGG